MKISFRQFFVESDTDYKPKPSIKGIPEWFKSIPVFFNNNKKLEMFGPRQGNASIKWCTPVMDSLSSGYLIFLETDIYVKNNENGEKEFIWNIGGKELVTSHPIDQISKKQIPDGYEEIPYKFGNNWSIKTPKGYSSLFIHPLNRTDLPFMTMSGVVDTDTYHIPVNFPFFIKKDFEGIIEAGTPISQVIPIKRESWSHEILPYDSKFSESHHNKFLHKIYRSYKNSFWHKKDYR